MKQRILIVNGPNLNLLGRREPEIYGYTNCETILSLLRQSYPDIVIDYFQSNHEGAIIDTLQQAGYDDHTGIILNAGAYTHTSLAIADCVAAISAPVIEVHISNIHAREEIRHRSLIAPVAAGSIVGLGTDVYRLGVEALKQRL